MLEKQIIREQQIEAEESELAKRALGGIEGREKTNHLIVESAKRHKLAKDTAQGEYQTRVRDKSTRQNY